jgi:hypothetical protein
MSEKDDEPINAAFPTQDASAYYHGMMLRDYFAAQALNGLLSDAESITAMREKYGRKVTVRLAAACYSFADAMLAERAK